MLQQIFSLSFMTAFLAAAVRLAVPLMYGGIGETIAEKSGILNIGMEGVMLSGAFFSFAGAWYSGNLFVGLYFCFTVGGLGAGDVKLYMVSALFLRPEETMYFLLLSMGLALGMFLIRCLWERTHYIRLAVPMFVSLGIMIVYRKAF